MGFTLGMRTRSEAILTAGVMQWTIERPSVTVKNALGISGLRRRRSLHREKGLL